jgi:hypothetical protein
VKIGYWILTVMLCLFLAFGAYMDLSHGPQMLAGVASLGYPEYFLNIDGIAKILAVLALLVPLPGFSGVRAMGVRGAGVSDDWCGVVAHCATPEPGDGDVDHCAGVVRTVAGDARNRDDNRARLNRVVEISRALSSAE